MKLIPTEYLKVEQVINPTQVWTILVPKLNSKGATKLYEPFSDIEVKINKEQERLINIEDGKHCSCVSGFRCYSSIGVAMNVQKKLKSDTNYNPRVCPVLLPAGSHIIKYDNDVYTNQFCVLSGD